LSSIVAGYLPGVIGSVGSPRTLGLRAVFIRWVFYPFGLGGSDRERANRGVIFVYDNSSVTLTGASRSLGRYRGGGRGGRTVPFGAMTALLALVGRGIFRIIESNVGVDCSFAFNLAGRKGRRKRGRRGRGFLLVCFIEERWERGTMVEDARNGTFRTGCSSWELKLWRRWGWKGRRCE